MKKLSVPLALVMIFVGALNVTAMQTPSDENDPSIETEDKKPGREIGRVISDFVLPDSAGQKISLSDFAESKLVVAIFMGTECPIGNTYVPTLLEMQKRFADKKVSFIGINSNLADSAENIGKHIAEFDVSFPVLVDKDQVVADLFAAKRTPEVFLLDSQRKVRYQGRIDDRFGYIYKRDESRRQELVESIDELLAGEDVSVPQTEPVGCLITRRQRLNNSASITFSKEVSRIIQDRCTNCHHPDTAAPFSLLSYQDARDWADMIKEVVVQRRMPPWNADPRHGKFSNDLRLTQEEIDTLVAWIDNGTPLGDESELPPQKEYADGWTIGQPDLVFEMPREYTVKANGTVRYKYFVTPTNLEQDVWVQAAEARPGNRSVVHHIIVFYRMPGTEQLRDLPALVGTAPGEEPLVFPQGTGRKIPAGAELVWQLHYTPTGKIEKDVSQVGFVLCKAPPKRQVHGAMAINPRFEIPPGANNHEVVSETEFKADAELLSLMPHMHLRGKDFRYTAYYPDGRSEILLNVPHYDFNWQHRYRFATPLMVPKGTRIECVAHFDNSADNPANPDPTKTVTWGDQTWEEMMIGFINYVDAAPVSED